MTDDRDLPIDHEPLNRAERRAQRYRPKAGQADPHAIVATPGTDEAPEAAREVDEPVADDEAVARSGSGDVTRMTGAGAGGATESDGRVAHHEGVHLGNQPNS
jgi:hypothetical protein